MKKKLSLQFPIGYLDLNNSLNFSDLEFKKIIEMGGFTVKTPDFLDPYLQELSIFSQNFFKNSKGDHLDKYRNFNQKFNQSLEEFNYSMFEGYMIHNHKGNLTTRSDQLERFSLIKSPIKNNWLLFPEPINQALIKLQEFGSKLLCSILIKLGLSKYMINKITGNAISGKGEYNSIFNYYNSSIDKIGVVSHEDRSLITLLHSSSEGLEVKYGENWVKIKQPNEKTLTILFGVFIDFITKELPIDQHIKCLPHRVCQQTTPRYSFTIFIKPFPTTTLYTLSERSSKKNKRKFSSQKLQVSLQDVLNQKTLDRQDIYNQIFQKNK